MLEWVFRRCEDAAGAVDTPIGRVPAEGALNVDGLDLAPKTLAELLRVDEAVVRAELPQIREHLDRFGETMDT